MMETTGDAVLFIWLILSYKTLPERDLRWKWPEIEMKNCLSLILKVNTWQSGEVQQYYCIAMLRKGENQTQSSRAAELFMSSVRHKTEDDKWTETI